MKPARQRRGSLTFGPKSASRFSHTCTEQRGEVSRSSSFSSSDSHKRQLLRPWLKNPKNKPALPHCSIHRQPLRQINVQQLPITVQIPEERPPHPRLGLQRHSSCARPFRKVTNRCKSALPAPRTIRSVCVWSVAS